MSQKRTIKRIYPASASLLLVFFLFIAVVPLNSQPVIAGTVTKPPKACHICDPVLSESTATPTPDACAVDCLEADQTREPQLDPQRSATPKNTAAEVSLVFYWMDGCPHCEEVMQTTLAELEQTYRARLDIQKIELVSVEDVDQLYVIGQRMGMPNEKIEVPFVMINEQALSGKEAITRELPSLLEHALGNKGASTSIPSSGLTPTSPLLIVFAVIVLGFLAVIFIKKRSAH